MTLTSVLEKWHKIIETYIQTFVNAICKPKNIIHVFIEQLIKFGGSRKIPAAFLSEFAKVF